MLATYAWWTSFLLRISKFCYRALRCIRRYLDLHTAKTIATSFVHANLSILYGFPKYQINRLQHIPNAVAWIVVQAQNSNASLVCWNLFTGLTLLNELNKRLSLSLSNFSTPLSHYISMSLYLFSLFMVTTQALHLTSLRSNRHSKSLIAPFDMLHFIFGTSFLHHSEFRIKIIHLSDHHLKMPV